MMSEDKIIVKQITQQYDTADITEKNTAVDLQETVEVIEVADIETMMVETGEAFSALGDPNDMSVHKNLHGITDPDQHPIVAISGLKEALDSLNTKITPQTIYSDKFGVANYYAWNYGAYHDFGYFVSLVQHTSTVQICDGSDIFGVTIDSAGFIGGQDESIPRDYSYALVATSGLVDVRCETDVTEGDYVVSNAYGIATKTDSNCGYKVVAIERKNGVDYAAISLGVQACTTDAIGQKVQHLDDRMNDAEINIAAAMNVANDAHLKANECIASNGVISDKVDDVITKVDDMSTEVDNLGSQVSSISLTATQAKTIAENTATFAESMKKEAVEKANEALADTVELRKELETMIDETETDLENTVLELEAVKESLDITKNSLQDSIDDAASDIEALEKDLEPLVTWPDAENPTGIAGFVAQANEDSVTLGGLVKWQGETNESIAAFKQEVADNYATQKMVSVVSDNLALFQQEVKDDYATQEMVSEVENVLTAYKQEVKKDYATQQMLSSVEDNLANYKQEVTNTYATQQMVTAVGNNLTNYKQEATKIYATQEMVSKVDGSLTSFKQEVKDNYATQQMVTQVNNALSIYKQEVSNTYVTNAALVTLRTDTTNAIAASEEKATATYASKSDLTSFESNTNIAMARIEQKADANGAYIYSTVSNMDKYSVGPYSQAQGFTLNQAKTVLEVGMIYVPTVSHSGETYNTSYNFTTTNTYTWSGTTWIESVGKVVFSASVPSGNAYPLWYTNSSTASDGYEPYTLYKLETYQNEAGNTLSQWVAVATLSGNSSNRAVSQIRQDANSIDLSVTNMKGDVTSSKNWISNNDANIQDVVSWKSNNANAIATTIQSASDSKAYIAQIASVKNSDGSVNAAASIVTAVNNEGSSVTINANKINFTGFTTFLRASDLGASGTTSIDGARITTGKISADRIDVSNVITVGGIAKTSDIPKNTSALTNDSGFAYNSQIPTKVSQLSNDSGYKNESGVTSIVKGVITTDYVNALGITVDAAKINGKLTADQIDTTKLVVGASNIAADSVGTTQLKAKSVSSVIIADGAVTASKVSADIVTANKLATAGSGVVIEGSNITTGTINADRIDVEGIIKAGSIITGTIDGDGKAITAKALTLNGKGLKIEAANTTSFVSINTTGCLLPGICEIGSAGKTSKLIGTWSIDGYVSTNTFNNTLKSYALLSEAETIAENKVNTLDHWVTEQINSLDSRIKKLGG